jgi:hypothetical protein
MPPARRGYGYGSGSAVVDGMPVVPVQACQGSYAPAWAIGMVRLNWFGRWRTNVLMPRALFVGKPQPEAQRTAQRRQDRRAQRGACERSEVLTARERSALQSHAVFRRNAPQKS